MRYVSTDGSTRCDLREAVTRCYAPAGGLYLPETLPVIPRAFLNNIREMSLREIAYVVMSAFLSDTTPREQLKEVVDDAFDFDIPLVQLPGGPAVLELFGGPTLAFKDISARFMARYTQTLPQTPAGRPVLLVATTGNTGAAIARAFAGLDQVDVVILYPRGAMTAGELFRYGGDSPRVHAIEVAGTIADCKRLVREAVTAPSPVAGMTLLSGNTHNIMRLLPQVVYFFHAYARLLADAGDSAADGFTLAVPCGNLSNLTSAVMARRMGLPAGRIVAGCAGSDTLSLVLEGKPAPLPGTIEPKRTLARAMDSGYPTNLPRLLALYGGSAEAMRADISAISVSDDEIADTMRRIDSLYGYTADPHTAVACAAAARLAPADRPTVVLATSHPYKEADTVARILGHRPAPPAGCPAPAPARRPGRIPPTAAALRKALACGRLIPS